MRRGDVYWVDFEPARGSEPNKKRPAIIVSRDESNTYVAHHGLGTLTVVPLTSNTKIYCFVSGALGPGRNRPIYRLKSPNRTYKNSICGLYR